MLGFAGGKTMAGYTPTLVVGAKPRPDSAVAVDEGSDRYVLSVRVRALAVAFAVVMPPILWWMTQGTRGERAYFMALGASVLPYTLPLLLAGTLAVTRGDPDDRMVWRLWFSVSCSTIAFGAFLYLAASTDLDRGKSLAPLGAAMATLGIIVANTVVLRARSGKRRAVLDAIDLLMATMAVVVPVALVVAEPIVTSPQAWYTVACAIAAVGWCHGVFNAMALVARLERGQRVLAWIGLSVAVAAVLDAAAQIVQGLNGFQYSSGPFIAAHAACLSLITLFYVFVTPRSSPGLDRLPPQRQVRRSGAIALGILVAGPVTAVETWWWRDRAWVVTTAAACGLVLLLLACVRHLLLVRETTWLYGEVEAAAEERKRLLADLMAHTESDRGRAAAHLHQQAVSLHTAMASFAGALEGPASGLGPGVPSVAGMAAERMRMDLARQVEWLRQVLTVVAPVGERGPSPERLTAPIRAYVGNLYSDGPKPAVRVEVDPRLDLDWTTEVVTHRIVQEAIHNVWRHAGATSIDVRITAPVRALEIEVVDDGTGFDPGAAAGRESGIATMRALAEFADGRLEVTSAPGHGTRVRAVLGGEGPPPTARADLRVVTADG